MCLIGFKKGGTVFSELCLEVLSAPSVRTMRWGWEEFFASDADALLTAAAACCCCCWHDLNPALIASQREVDPWQAN
jgi:hypothetical protein